MNGISATCKQEIQAGNVSTRRTGIESRWWRWWRILCSGFSFSLFLMIALLLAIAVFPVIRFVSRTRERSQARVRAVIHFMFGWIMNVWSSLPVMHAPRIHGREILDRVGPCIIVANHPTLIDAVLLGSLVPNFNCVAKPALCRDRFLGGPIRAAGYVASNDAREVIRLCQEGFARGQSLIIFPEGSRSFETGLRPFSRGAVQLAVRTGLPLVPAVIRCSPPTLMKHQRWFEVPERAFQLSLQFYPPLEYQAQDAGDEQPSRKARRFNDQIEEFFRKELGIETVRS